MRGMNFIFSLALSLGLVCAVPMSAQSGWQPEHTGIGFGQAADHQFLRMVSSPEINLKSGAAQRQPLVLRFVIQNGLHINSHNPRSRFLIPTVLTLDSSPGIAIARIEYPSGADYHFDFSPKESVSVYTGGFPVYVHLRAERGRHSLHGQLRYQACDNRTCNPPKSLPLTLDITAK